MAYATVDDLQLRWRDLSEQERERAAALLDDAAVLLDGELAAFDLQPDGLLKQLKAVSCSMVLRVMMSGDYAGYSSVSRTAGSFNEQVSLANPSADMYLTSAERRRLGITLGRGRASWVGI